MSNHTRKIHDIPILSQHSQAIRECEAMISYAQSLGKPIPEVVFTKFQEIKQEQYQIELASKNLDLIKPNDISLENIGDVHNALSNVIAPATPATILLMERSKQSNVLLRLLGPVPLVRKLMFVTFVCLFGFLGLFASDLVDGNSINGDILNYPQQRFILNQLVIVSIAALGASFYALFEVYKYISNDSYDPKYDSIYWVRFILGVVSGVILAQFVMPIAINPDNNPNSALTQTGIFSYKPLLAFLGGFSARVVHKILNSLVESIETFVSGSARDMIVAREELAKTQLQDQIKKLKMDNANKMAKNQLSSTIALMKLQQEINNGANPEQLKQQIDQLMNEMIRPIDPNGLKVGQIPPKQPISADTPLSKQVDFMPGDLNNPVVPTAEEMPTEEFTVPPPPEDFKPI